MISNLFYFMDLFGYGINFKINKQDRVYSWKVGLLSSIMVVGSLIYIIGTCLKWFKNNYTTKSVKVVVENLPQVSLSSNNDFMFLYCLGTQNNSTERIPIINYSMNITLRWRYVSKFPYEMNGEVPIEMKKCSRDLFNKSVVNRFTYNKYDGCLCVNSDNLLNDISYFMTDSYFTFYDLQVKFNDSILKNKTQYNYMVDYFNNNTPVGYFYYLDTTADIDQYSKPFTYFMNFHSQVLNPTSLMISNIYLTNINMEIDDNVIYDRPINYKGVSVDRELTNTKTGITFDSLRNYDCMHSVRLYASNKKMNLVRTNMKYDQFIGNIFSFLMPFYLILIFFSNKMDSKEAKQVLIHNLFKNYRTKNQIIKKIKYTRESFNEVEEIKETKQNITEKNITEKNISEKNISEKNNTLEALKNVTNHKSLEILKNKRKIRWRTDSSNNLKDAKVPERTISITMRKSDNSFNNDPFNLKANKHAEEKLYLEEVFNRINEIEFKYDWFKNYFMKCTKKKEKYLLREKYFECAESLVNYYLDISIYFKKMIEVDLMKSLHFDSQQRLLLNYCSDCDFSFKTQEKIIQLLNDIYNRNSIIDVKLENELSDIIKKSRQDQMTDKIVELIENNNIFTD